MSQPAPYTRQVNFTAYALANPGYPINPANLDTEFNAVMLSLDEAITNLGLIQRDDGGLQNEVVTPDSLNQATINMIGEWNPRGAWVTATNYAVRDMVTPSGGTATYVCAVAHTSGATFSGDLALGYWQSVNGSGSGGGGTPATFTFSTNNVVLGRATSGGGAGEEIPCTAAARSIMDDASVAAICTTLGLGTTSDPTFSDVTVDTIKANGFTASTMLYADATKTITSAAATNGQLLIGSTGAVPVVAGLTGTSNQVTVTNGAGSITLGLPQNIDTSATPVFTGARFTGLSSGSVAFIGGSSALSQDTANFTWDNTNKRLGLGTASPTSTLHVVGSGLFSVGMTLSFLTAGSIPFAGVAGAISQDNTNFFWDDTNNRLGIGTATPTVALDVVGAAHFTLDSQVARSASAAAVLFTISNTENTNAASHAQLLVQSGGNSGGDAKTVFTIPSGDSWAMGIDNSDSDNWKLSAGTALGTNDAITVTSTGRINTGGSLNIGGYFASPIPVTIAAASGSVAVGDSSIIVNNAGTCTLTLPAAATYPGRELKIRTITANAVISASSNVVPQVGGAAGTAILPATDGAWTLLVSDGSSWQQMMSSIV